MSTKEATRKIILLNQCARRSESKGDEVFAAWYSERARELEKTVRDTDKFLDKFFEYSEVRRNGGHSKRDNFISEWYEYEEEYSYNFSME